MRRLDGDEEEKMEDKAFHFYEQQIIRRVFHFYLSTIIGDPVHYVDMIHRIQTAGAEDIIFIHLNTPGGNLDTGIQIVNAMKSSPAHVVCSVEAESHSLGTLIFLAADEWIVHDNCLMMFHNYSGGTYGKGNEQQAHLEASIRWFNELAAKIYIPFLTEDELHRILKGEDIYVHTDDIRERLNIMVQKLEEEKRLAEEAEAEPVKKKRAPRKKAPRKKG